MLGTLLYLHVEFERKMQQGYYEAGRREPCQ